MACPMCPLLSPMWDERVVVTGSAVPRGQRSEVVRCGRGAELGTHGVSRGRRVRPFLGLQPSHLRRTSQLCTEIPARSSLSTISSNQMKQQVSMWVSKLAP